MPKKKVRPGEKLCRRFDALIKAHEKVKEELDTLFSELSEFPGSRTCPACGQETDRGMEDDVDEFLSNLDSAAYSFDYSYLEYARDELHALDAEIQDELARHAGIT